MVSVSESRAANEWRNAKPMLTDDIRLLLLLSRVKLDSTQRARALELSRSIANWDAFARSAAEHFAAPLCLHHFTNALGEAGFSEARQALNAVVRPMVIQTLKLAGLQKRFLKNHVECIQSPCAVIKGRALGARYYPDPSLRFSRDLDILLAVEEIPGLIVSAQKSGYRVYPEMREITIGEAYVLSRQCPVITLLGQERIGIEIHTQLDKVGFLLDHREMLDRLDRIEVDGQACQTLSIHDHFVYICLHHTKHFWSRLNWLTDLDAILSSPDFDKDEALKLASDFGLERTVVACLGFHSACAATEPWEEASKNNDVLDLMRACLLILNDGSAKEFDMRPDRLSLDFNFEWQFPSGYTYKKNLERFRSVFRPSTADYGTLALPRNLYWVYYPLRPLLLLARRSGF